MTDNLIPSVVDGPILPERMCLGSESRQVMFNGDQVQCFTCQRWLPAYPGSFLAPVHSVDGGYWTCYEHWTTNPTDAPCPSCLQALVTMAEGHHPECDRCWYDFILEHNTDHACDCLTCVQALPADHRWTDSCSCDACLPDEECDTLLPDGGCEACWLSLK